MRRPFRYTILVVSIAIVSAVSVYAGNPGTPILPSDNIQDPGAVSTPWGGCGPSDSNCYVTTPSGGSSQWTTSGSDIYYSSGKVGIGVPKANGPLQVSELQYSTGTASQSGTTVTGVGTTWGVDVIGNEFVFADGSRAMITARSSNTSLTVDVSQTVSSQSYGIYYVSLSVENGTGDVSIGSIRNPASNSRLFIYGGNSGANIDARGVPGQFMDIAQFEAEGADYGTLPNSLSIRYFGSTAAGSQTIMGFDSNRLGVLDFINNTTSLIRSNTSIHFGGGTSDLVTMTLDPTTRRVGIGTTTPSAMLHLVQPTPATVATTSVTATASPLTLVGGNGASTTSNGGTVNAGNAGTINITGGNGGAILGAPTTGAGGTGGIINITGGDGGLGTTFGGAGGSVEIQGGNGGGGTSGGTSGYAALKAGNAGPSGNANGGNVYIVSGMGNGSGIAGEIFLGLSPSATVRGNVTIGSATAGGEKLSVFGNFRLSGAFMPNNLAGSSGQVLTSAGAGVAPTWTTPVATWNLGGNAGTTPGTDFIGTTDFKPLIFKTQNVESGRIDNLAGNVSLGQYSLNVNASGANLVAIGHGAMISNVSGSNNTALGQSSLRNNVGGGYNTALGVFALGNTDSSNNIGIGYLAGFNNTSASNQIFINSINRGSYAGDQTLSPIYVQQSASMASQYIALNGMIGINNINPSFMLHVGSASVTDGTTLLRLQDSNSTCDFNANTGAPSCGSDITLKKDIASLDTTDLLTKVSVLNPVSYRWLTEDSSAQLQYGFIAQEVGEQFPDLVSDHTWIDGTTRKFLNMGGLMPYAIGAIKEMNLKIIGIEHMDTPNSWRDSLTSWLSNAGNHITRIFTGEICLTDGGDSECINKSELRQLKALLNQSSTPPSATTPAASETPSTDESSDQNSSGNTGGENGSATPENQTE